MAFAATQSKFHLDGVEFDGVDMDEPRPHIAGAEAEGQCPVRRPKTERERMTTFDKREEGFERKFVHDQELRFKAIARRNKLLGAWAASQLGKSGEDATAYAKAVILADFEEAGDDDVVRKVKGDLDAAGFSYSESDIRSRMTEFMARAMVDIQAGL
jgi:hypothetical protein